MVTFYQISGILSLLLVLHWKQGAGSPLSTTPDMATCTTDNPCPSKIMSQIKKQLKQLNSSVDTLLNLYYHSQGEPFASMVDVLCNHDLMDFPSFHADGKRKNKLVELYHIFSYLGSSLGNILQYQRTLNPSDQNLHSKLSSSVGTMRGILSNVFCHLCNKYHVGHVDVAPVSDTSAMSTFENKRLGCRLLGKYKQVITELAQAF